MEFIGFSTGALALSDFRRGVELQRDHKVNAIELSALREDELSGLINSIDSLDLSQFTYRSFHAPSRLTSLSNAELVERLRPVADKGFCIVVHPDIIDDFGSWRTLGTSILLENMDQRKKVCRTAREMAEYFVQLPESRFCFDIGHARQVDPTMSIAVDLLMRFRKRLAEIHVSEVNWSCRHVSISTASALAYSKIASLIPHTTPVIIESLIPSDQIDKELRTVRRCLQNDQPFAIELPFSDVGRFELQTP